jgi:lauroyl/myristoyl acyltransferase
MTSATEPKRRLEIVARIDGEGARDAAIVYRLARPPKDGPPLLGAGDLLEVLRFYGAMAATLLMPQAWWPGYCRLAARLRLRRHRRRTGPAFRAGLNAILGEEGAARSEDLLGQKREQAHRRRLSIARELTGRGRAPEITLEGANGLRAALDRGRGAIVWVSDTYPRMILSKRALWEAGFRPHQVSRVEHGLGNSRFAIAAINPLVLRAEDRYLAGRVLFAAGEETDVMRRILRLLGQGGLVLMTNNQYSGAMFLEVPFGRDGYISLPTATLNLAARHGVPLFTLAAIETRPLAAWRVTIGPEIAAAPAGARDREALHRAMAALAMPVRDQMLATFRAAPEQFRPLGERGFGASRFPAMRRGDAVGNG